MKVMRQLQVKHFIPEIMNLKVQVPEDLHLHQVELLELKKNLSFKTLIY